jgi:hypothetical protein
MTRLWHQVLRGTGLDDHFLDAGGASLQSLQLELLIGRAFGVVVPPGSSLGAGATIRGMLAIVRDLREGEQ